MTPTERERIENEAEKISKNMPNPRYQKLVKLAYVDGATAEHDKARNQAIDDCLIILSRQSGTDWVNRNFLKHELENLKTKP